MARFIRNFREFAFLISPPWLRRRLGERFVGAVAGLMADSIQEGIAQGLRVPWLLSGFQPPDALPMIGSERSMPRYPPETDEIYRTRLHGAWDAWGVGGNEAAIIAQLNAFGLSNVLVVPAVNGADTPGRDEWSFEHPNTIEVTGSFRFDSIAASIGPTPEIVLTVGTLSAPAGPGKVLFSTPLNGRRYVRYSTITGNRIIVDIVQQHDSTFDFVNEGPISTTLDFTDWSRFIVIIDQPHPYVEWTYGSGPVYSDGDDAMTYGSTMTVGTVNAIKGIIRKWKAGHTINPLILVIMEEGPYYGEPGSEYGDVGLVYADTFDAIAVAHQS